MTTFQRGDVVCLTNNRDANLATIIATSKCGGSACLDKTLGEYFVWNTVDLELVLRPPSRKPMPEAARERVFKAAFPRTKRTKAYNDLIDGVEAYYGITKESS